jgi:hypothetical protein
MISIKTIVVFLLSVTATPAAVLLETAGTNYSNGGPGLGFRGTLFSVSTETRLTGFLTPVIAYDFMGPEIDATAYLLRHSGNFVVLAPAGPFAGSLQSAAIATSVLSVSNPGGVQPNGTNVELSFLFNEILSPGDYAIIVAGEAAAMPSSTSLISGNSTNVFANPAGGWSYLADNFRFVVEGEAIPESGTSLLCSLALLALLTRRSRGHH